ncbi:MAG: peptidase T [Bacteroidales bacterium]|nr:peptidase T [Bacteroidales bacterium]
MEKIVERFISYAKINTQSDESSKTCPTTRGQLELAHRVMDEMQRIGLDDVAVDKNGYLTATLPGNIKTNVPVIGFIAHFDTSPEFTGEGVNPQIVEFTGKDITLNKKDNIILSPDRFPLLKNYTGQQIITTDGNTLLGADDKAGIAEIITAMEFLKEHPEIPHGKIRIGFTPDEEIGRGADRFDVQAFGAEFAYTVDGSGIGELEYENFNAAKAKITINGLNVHPGYSKDKMKNSILIAMELNHMLPASEIPQHTENYEGFFHLLGISGSVERTTTDYIIRDHDRERFEMRKKLLAKSIDYLNLKYGEQTVDLEMMDQYYNMKEKILPVFHVVDLALKAIQAAGITPKTIPIRGGTDGSKLSYMDLPCPNLFGGGHNFHSRYEFIPVRSMEKAVEVIVNIAKMNAEEHTTSVSSPVHQ